MTEIRVELGDRSYDVRVGAGLLSTLGAAMDEAACSGTCLVAIDEGVRDTHGPRALAAIGRHGRSSSVHVEGGEAAKTVANLQRLWDAMRMGGLDRASTVIAIGGGAVTDMAAFAAATWMRGVPLVLVPTTLLAMVDAAIGGKTAINLPVRGPDGTTVAGKNLVGAFWQPRLVLADVETLTTLEPRHLRCGLAECVKHALLGHDDLLDFIEEHAAAITTVDLSVLEELVARSAAIKAAVVAQDEREAGSRMLLNLGHTFAHAIEPIGDLGLLHGEAVSIGLVAAAAAAASMGRIDAADASRISDALGGLGLPVAINGSIAIEDLNRLMAHDKKAIDGALRLVLPGAGGASVVDDVPAEAIAAGWEAVGAGPRR